MRQAGEGCRLARQAAGPARSRAAAEEPRSTQTGGPLRWRAGGGLGEPVLTDADQRVGTPGAVGVVDLGPRIGLGFGIVTRPCRQWPDLGRLEGGDDDAALFGREARHQLEHAVLVAPPPGHPPGCLLPRRRRGILGRPRAPGSPADGAELRRRGVPGDGEPDVLVLGGGDVGEQADLVEGEVTGAEGVTRRRQRGQGVADPEHLGGRVPVEPGGDGQPLLAAAHPLAAPAAALVEAGDLQDEGRGGGVDVGRCLTDRCAKSSITLLIIANIRSYLQGFSASARQTYLPIPPATSMDVPVR